MKALERQLTGMAGEFLAASKLFKRGYQVAVTMGNAKSIDLFVYNPHTERKFAVQVKTLRKKNCFLINKEDILDDDIYIFILLNKFEDHENIFIIDGKTINSDINKFFGSCYKEGKCTNMPAINYGPLAEYENNWDVFDK